MAMNDVLKRRIVSAFAPSLLVLSLSACGNSPPPALPPELVAARSWLLVSDIHFNPFDDPNLVSRLVADPAVSWHLILSKSSRPPSPYFSDTNFALLESALSAMQANVRNPPVVVIAGDFLGHNFPAQFAKFEPSAPPSLYTGFVDKTIKFLALEFNAAYPQAQFVITLGNNDGYCGDYMSTPDSPFLAHMATAWLPLVNRNATAPNFVHDFSTGGYYTSSLPAQAAVPAVVTNSVFWSASYQDSCGMPSSDPGSTELDWLASTLSSEGPARPLLLTHIPPGIDEYASIKNNAATPLYKEAYTQRFLGILAQNGVDPRAFILGHIHHATFELTPTGGGQLPAFVVPSISPNQGNNPAFMTALIDPKSSTISDTRTFFLQLAPLGLGWAQLYTFTAAYSLPGFDTESFQTLQNSIAASPLVRGQFFNFYNSASPVATPAPGKWQWYWCGHTNLTPTPYSACVSSHVARRAQSASEQ